MFLAGILLGLSLASTSIAPKCDVPAISDQTFAYNANDQPTSDRFDANGNTLQGALAAVGIPQEDDEYSAQNELIERVNADGSRVRVIYDGDGQRVRKEVTSPGGIVTITRWLIDDLNPTGYPQVVEEQVDGVLRVVYTYGNDLIAQDRLSDGGAWQLSYYVYDGQGNVRLLTDEQGQPTDRYLYDAFGE